MRANGKSLKTSAAGMRAKRERTANRTAEVHPLRQARSAEALLAWRMPELFLLVGRRFVAAGRSRWDLALENLVLRHQLQVALRTNPRPRLRGPDRILWVWLRRLWPRGWWGPTFVLRSSIRDGSTL